MPKISFQWFFDLATAEGVMQKLTVRAGGREVIKRLAPQFAAYKYFKLGKISLKMVPASTLPVDPTGLSYSAGENTVDPRDQLTPGMVRITNGESVANLPEMTPDVAHDFYNQMILDRRWFKWSLQSGLKKTAIPLFWSIAVNQQTPYPLSKIHVPLIEHSDVTMNDEIVDTNGIALSVQQEQQEGEKPKNVIKMDLLDRPFNDGAVFVSNNSVRLGWLPTDVMHSRKDYQNPSLNDVPAVDCFTILLPPAYKTKYYYRCYVNETVFFKEPITNYNVGDGPYYTSVDRFIRPSGVLQLPPFTPDPYPDYPPNMPITNRTAHDP